MIFVIAAFAIYFLGLVLLLIGWRAAMKQKAFPVTLPLNAKITVIVPFRNETKNITRIILDLTCQDYSSDNVEVILCNDHSVDESELQVNTAIQGHGNFKLIHSPGEGKKEAIAYAIEKATGEIMVTTDADCRLPVNWLTQIRQFFYNPGIQMVFGGVKIEDDGTFFSGLQAMEFSSLVGSGAATLSLGVPTMCNGANLAFRKSAFHSVDGYQGNLDIPSGDDEFLLRKINKQFPGSIGFMNGDSVVSTRAQESVPEFIQQRLRWAGKWKRNSAPAIALAFFVLTVQVLLIGLLVLMVFSSRFLSLGLIIITIKFFLEGIFLFQVGSFLRLKWSAFNFLALQLLYPVYVIIIGLTANFSIYRWKGRKFEAS